MLKIKEGFVLHNILDEWMVLPVGQRKSNETAILQINETGHFLWELLQKGATEEELLRALLQAYDAEESVAGEDIRDFLKQLREKGII